jgi:hypothetical protein
LFLKFSFLLLLACMTCGAQPNTPDWKKIPIVDGGVGKCSVDFTVTDADHAPVYDAKISVHIAYGFMRARKLDLQVGTNSDGKARFEGLPAKVREPLTFVAAKQELVGTATYDPAVECNAKHEIVLEAKKKDVN